MKSGMIALLPLMLVACHPTPKPQWLMPTPQLFMGGKVNPFAHLPERDKSPDLGVFYAANRKPERDDYGNDLDAKVRFGTATVIMGGPDETWKSLAEASTVHPRTEPIEMSLAGSRETTDDSDRAGMKRWAKKIDADLQRRESKEIIIYVHGARVGFLHSCAFAAELNHFAGRDFTTVAFDWPSHQEIFSYIDRTDLDHAKRSGAKLAETLRLLSSETSVRRIHVVSWSAGARVLSRAMVDLAAEDAAKFRSKYRIGTVVFAAGDVPEKDFIERLPAIHGLSDRTLVYVSDDDSALRWAARLMGGGQRLGLVRENPTAEEIQILATMKRLEVIDTSYGKAQRGFDIAGHRYWFQHPWVNSDLILALRTGAGPAKRGLSAAPLGGVWYFGGGYPEKIGGIGRSLTSGEW